MQRFEQTTSRLLIWLTAIAMPFQAGWSVNCGCCSANQPAAITAVESTPTSCCSKPAKSEFTCCEARAPQRICCTPERDPHQDLGCHCGPSCECVDHQPTPPQRSPSAPDNGRTQSSAELGASQSVAVCATIPFHGDRGHTAGGDSAFCQPSAQVCVLLCRFTL